jgi:hypothetical protein
MADLEADIEEAESDWEEDLQEAIAASKLEKQDAADAKGATASSTTASQSNGTEPDPVATERQLSRDSDGDCAMMDVVHPAPDRPAPLPPPPPPPPAAEQAVAAAEVDDIFGSIPIGTVLPYNGTYGSASIPIRSRYDPPEATRQYELPLRRYELTTSGPAEGPVTPRNDAGPFVLDGSGHVNQRRDDEVVPPAS